MIQRIQSIFLLVIVLCGVVLYFLISNPIVVGGITDLYSGACFISNYLSVLLSIIILFQYKKRSLQIRLCLWLGVINILLLILILRLSFLALAFSGDIFQSTLFSLLPLTATISSFLARRYIKKDEELVRSADRIR